MKRAMRGIILVAVCCVLTACTHPMRIKNIDQYRTTPNFSAADRPVDVGITSTRGDFAQSAFYHAIIEKLASRPYIGKVQSNYKAGAQSNFVPDCVVSIEPNVDFKGSVWNWFPITFPGFLIFTNAWNGYVYTANATTKITIYDAEGGVVDSFDVDTSYKIRHCDFGRGFWSGTGWWFPGLGATNLITGLFMIQYDDDATEPFLEKVRDNYSSYIVEKIYNSSSFKTVMQNLPDEKVEVVQQDDIESALKNLFEMKESGLISDEEYQRLKEKAINRY